MLQVLNTHVKLAVDIDRGILAGGGADWVPSSGEVHYEALINLRPHL